MSISKFLALALCLIAAPAAAVVVTSVAGAPDPGVGAGQTLVVSFDAPNHAGITETDIGNVIIAAGSTSGVRAAPAGTAAGGVYMSIGTGGSATFDFTGFIDANKKLGSISLYWGSIDAFNYVDFLDANNVVISSFGGNQLPQFDGDQTEAVTNRRVDFAFNSLEKVTQVRLRSTGNAFELDSIGASIAAVPEPAAWLTLIAGFGFVGVAARRRRGAVVAA